jgi:hypothetical protein
MPTITRTIIRSVAVDADQALALWNEGRTIRQIVAALAPGACRMSVVRALRRAVKDGGVRLPATGNQRGGQS